MRKELIFTLKTLPGHFLFLLCFFFGCKIPCRQTISAVKCNGCNTEVTYIKTFPDCKDTLNYIDSAFEGKHLWFTGMIENKECNGQWTWFDSTGREIEVIFYDKGKVIKRIEKGNNIIQEYDSLNDSVQYYKKTTAKNKTIEEGHLLNSLQMGEWIFYDTISEQKIIANYIPILKVIDSIYVDENNPGSIVSSPIITKGLLNGLWKKYNKEGLILETKTYNQGVESRN
jgi:antitoxin component YwqK of YwqJK toxin-antitoxin module